MTTGAGRLPSRALRRTAAAALAALAVLAGCERQAAAPQPATAAAPAAAAASCSACHGAQGEGNPGAGFPRLAGQPRVFLQHQLDSFANGTRTSAVMEPLAHALSPQDRASAAARYARLAAPAAAPAASAPAPLLQRGRQVAEQGDAERQVQPCRNCHGVEGAGLGMQLPYLAGQPAPYLAAAMAAYRDGKRRDPTGQMAQIAQLLGDDDARAIAAYYASLKPPAAPLDVPPAPAPAAPPASR
jgi:cytochrome c553